MLCEHYKKALLEAAALSQAAERLAPKLREHVNTCAACGDELAMQVSLQNAIAMDLGQRCNGAVPANFTQRMLAGVESQRATKRPRSLFAPRWALAGACALVTLSVVLVRWHERTQILVPNRIEAGAQTTALEPAQSETNGAEVRHIAKGRRHSTLPETPEVLVAVGEQAALETYLRALSERQTQGAVTAGLEATSDSDSQDLRTVEVTPLVLKPLPDLGSDQFAASVRGRTK